MRFRQVPAVFVVACGLLSGAGRAAEEPDVPRVSVLEAAEPDKQDEEYLKKKQAAQQSVLEEYKKLKDGKEQKVSELATQRQKAGELGSAKVTIDEETKDVAEPATAEAALGLKQPVRDLYEVNPDDFTIYEHERWALNQSDFHCDPPQYIITDKTQGSTQKWFGFTFTLTNSTDKKRRVAPQFVAYTNKGVFNFAVGGFAPERILADAMRKPLVYSDSLQDKDLLSQGATPLEPAAFLATYAFDPVKGTSQLSPLATFEPGQTRCGAALWTNFSDEFTQLKIVVHGLTNAHRYDEKMRRVLVLTYERLDDEFNVQRVELKLKDLRWEYLWMWEQDISVPIPADAKDPQIKVQPTKTPSGADKLMWAFPFVLKNSTRNTQPLAINTVSFACPMEVDVAGAKVPVEVKIVDDGRSTIYKSQFLKALNKDAPKDRFELNKLPEEGVRTLTQRRTTSLDSGKALDELLAVFDEADVNWDDVKIQIESTLSEKIDKKAAAKAEWEQIVKQVAPDKPDLLAKNPGYLYDPRRQLTEDEFKAVREQISKGLAAAIEVAKAKKAVVAYFNCDSGLSGGTYRVSRSYRQPGVVQEEWLKAWEELDKAPAGAPAN